MTPYVVLDTDVVSRIYKGTLPPPLVRHLTGYATCVTFVTIAELEQWVTLRSWGKQRATGLWQWLNSMPHLGCDDDVAHTWGRLSAHARMRGRPRPTNDMWNAACALTEGLPLATLNSKDYADFSAHGLTILTG